MSIDSDQVKTWLNAAGAISFAIPEAGPIIGGVFMAAGALIPSDEQSAFDGWVSDLSNQFTKDQLAAQALVSEYFKDEFDTEWSNQDWTSICSEAAEFLEPSSDGGLLQDQVNGMVADVSGGAPSIKVSDSTFDDIRGQAWPYLYLTCGALLRLGGAYVLAQWKHDLDSDGDPVYPTTCATPAAGLLTDLSARYSDFATWYYNICYARRLRKIYWYMQNGQGGAPNQWIAVDEGFADTKGQEQAHDSEDDAKSAVIDMRSSAMSDLAGVFATSQGQESLWGTRCGADDWLTLKENWWGNYSQYVNSWANDDAPPNSAVPEPMQFVCWTQGRDGAHHIKDHIWSHSSLYLYTYTTVVSGVESGPSPLVAVQGSPDYVGIEFTVPADPTQLATKRNIYKSVISSRLDGHGSQAEMTVDSRLVGEVDGWEQQTFYDAYGYKVKSSSADAVPATSSAERARGG